MGVAGRVESSRHALSIESQLLAIGSGFIVFAALVGLFAMIQQRKRRNSNRDFHSPLIQTFNGNKQRFRATSRNFGSASSNGGSPPPMLSPTSSNSSNSPQCTPLTPYASFGAATDLPLIQHQAQNRDDRGSLSLGLNYDKETKSLQISLISCHGLPLVQNAAPNAYVKLRLLPENVHRVKTRVLNKNQNPFFDEQFTIAGVTKEQLQTYTLHLAVLASDRYNKDLVLGEAFIGLAEAERRRDLNDNESKENNLDLKLYPRPTYTDCRAQVFLSIAYNQLTNNVNVAVLKLKDLPSDERVGQIDPFVKIYMLLNNQRIAKHKTHVKKRCTEPVFNESFGFDLPSMMGFDGAARLQSADQILNAISFEIVVLNHNGVTRNEMIGHCIIDRHSQHWEAVRMQPGQQVAEWHRIQS